MTYNTGTYHLKLVKGLQYVVLTPSILDILIKSLKNDWDYDRVLVDMGNASSIEMLKLYGHVLLTYINNRRSVVKMTIHTEVMERMASQYTKIVGKINAGGMACDGVEDTPVKNIDQKDKTKPKLGEILEEDPLVSEILDKDSLEDEM